jgi:adenine-specific DNA methylase
MIPKECKRLAEVDFPIAVVSKHAAREKSIRHGHPSTLHLWWARRPLAACRAMLLGLLLPDPCDSCCPEDFKEKARRLLPPIQGQIGPQDEDLRRALLKFIGDFANWDLSADRVYLEAARGLVQAAHPEETPLVVDPFAGGGSIPLEALRLGCEAFASDLNPVACLILKVMLEDIPRYGRQKIKVKSQNGEEIEVDGLAEALRVVGVEVKQAAEKELGEFYPPDPDGARPIAYLWARTIRCEAPNCGAEIPLVRSFWLAKKGVWKREGKRRVKVRGKQALRFIVKRPKGESPYVEFEIFEPKNNGEVPAGTAKQAKATCPCCNTVFSPDRVRAQLREQRGGADVMFDSQGNRIGGARLLAVVTFHPDELGRRYRLPTAQDYEAVWKARRWLKKIVVKPLANRVSSIPDELLPLMSGTFNVPLYGINCWGDLFTNRQKLTMLTYLHTISKVVCSKAHSGGIVSNILALTISKMADTNSVICTWQIDPPRLRATFARQALPMTWDFAETSPLGDGAGNYELCVKAIREVLDRTLHKKVGNVEQADAAELPLPDETAGVWFIDPPYYFAVPYADLSDFFFVWLKRAFPSHPLLRDPFDPNNPLTPKDREICEMAHWDSERYAYKDKAFFEEGMRKAFTEGRRVLRDDGIGCVVFAHTTTEGWEALLSGMIRGGWVITGSWPITTELESRQRARESAALATSVHLVCRPRPEDVLVGDWGDVLRELPERVADWMERLQAERIRGADLVFACIGPALEIFSRYSKVETAEGREVTLAEYLEKVWEVVGRAALEQVLGTAEAQARNGAAGILEEDARLTALFLWTLQSTNGNDPSRDREGAVNNDEEEPNDTEDEEDEEAPRIKSKGYSLIFDVVRRFAQPLGIHLPDWEGRIIETKKGVVRLLSVNERAKQLFGEEGAEAVAMELEQSPFSSSGDE